jgi:hypothetical protein
LDDLNAITSLGLTLPSPAYLFGLLLFGLIGLAAYRYGNKAALAKPKWIGVALMLYPYAVTRTWLLYGIGFALCGALYLYRK